MLHVGSASSELIVLDKTHTQLRCCDERFVFERRNKPFCESSATSLAVIGRSDLVVNARDEVGTYFHEHRLPVCSICLS